MAKARLRPASILIAALFYATACSGGGERGEGRADTVTAPQATTTLEATSRRAPLDQAELAGALLNVQDMPTGFAVDTSEAPSRRGVCGHPAVSTVVPSFAEARIVFAKGTFGPFVQQVTASYEQADGAQQYMTKFRESVSCASYLDRGEDGTSTEITISALSFPRLGDDTFAIRTKNAQGGQADVVFFRVANTVTQLAVAGLIIDGQLTEDLARKAVSKVEGKVR